MIAPERVCLVLEGILTLDMEVKNFEDLVYRFVHVARETECDHPDWETEFIEMEKVIMEVMGPSDSSSKDDWPFKEVTQN